eukprot:gnl/MRDRNA2_/MRDRNA2_68956_c0_seq1.p1 gnl/MRDRNA2_/MRDRNA2_68956_c0~~gnl/MRDRNA2_/MRDRNA2_68956_c0_seq1.p1  ORF type:complete len:347 (-),score=56.88 gnl/MRDRNA2_/MRDRNA2_68956_c0_seq1:38-1078(-)
MVKSKANILRKPSSVAQRIGNIKALASKSLSRPSFDSATRSSGSGRIAASSCRTGLLRVLAPIACLSNRYEEATRTLAEVAASLLNEWDLIIMGKRYQIVEMETYVNGPTHSDPYVHGDVEQQKAGVWYFHKKGGSYKAGTFKGLDLSAGSKSSGVTSGLLLRSVLKVSDEGDTLLVEGPCLVVDHILKMTGAKSIAEFVEDRAKNGILPAEETPDLVLQPALHRRAQVVWAAPRVGLILRNPEAGSTHLPGNPPRFCTRPYRFSTVPHRLTKYRSGFALQKRLDDDMAAVEKLKLPSKILEGYFNSFEKGLAHNNPSKLYDAKLDNQQIFCEMVGACAKSTRQTG